MFVKNMALLFCSIIVSLGLAEVVVRFVYPEYGYPVYTTKLFTEFDPRLGWRKIPNFTGEHIQKEYRVIEKFNSKGLRGPEISYERTPNVPRVLFIGDSFTEGFAVEFPDVLTEVTRRELQKDLQKNVEVINAGTAGYSTDQEMMFYEDEGHKYSPDVTVLVFYGNDPPFNVRSDYTLLHRGAKPLFELANGKLQLKSLPEKSWDRDTENSKDLQKHKVENEFVPWNPSSWFLLRLVRHTFHAYNLFESESDLDPAEAYPEDLLHRDPETRQKEMDMTEALISRLNEDIIRDGGKLVIFYAPQRREVILDNGKIHRHTNSLEKKISEMAARLGIAFIPSGQVFLDQSLILRQKDQYAYWPQDKHWNVIGNKIAGTLVAEGIKDYLKSPLKKKEPAK